MLIALVLLGNKGFVYFASLCFVYSTSLCFVMACHYVLHYFKCSSKIDIYILSVYSPFSNRVALPLHNIFFVDLNFCHIHFYTL